MTKLEEIKQRVAGHTPGAWYQTDDEDYTYIFKDYKDKRYTIATAEDGWLECGANAALIAAAPDLLALCEEYDRELREAREEIEDLREQARMAGEWALLDPGERTAMLSGEQRDRRDAAAYCASLPIHKENSHE